MYIHITSLYDYYLKIICSFIFHFIVMCLIQFTPCITDFSIVIISYINNNNNNSYNNII